MKIFVIMPFSKSSKKHDKKYWTDFYSRLCDIINNKLSEEIKQIFKIDLINIFRAAAPQGNIVKNILKDLKKSEIVIAVLTDFNPNVFYELGIRHSLSNRTIMLCEEGKKIPFDLKNYGVGFYRENRRYLDIEKELLKRFKQIAEAPYKSDNPFYDVFKKFSLPNNEKFHKNHDYVSPPIQSAMRRESYDTLQGY